MPSANAPSGLIMALASYQGYLLTRNWRDTVHGIELEFWFSSDQGPIQVIVQRAESVFFLELDALNEATSMISSVAGVEIRELELRSFSIKPVVGIYCKNHRSARQLSDRLFEAGYEPLEADINPADRFLMERFIAGSAEINGEPTARNGFICFTNPQLKKGSFLPTLKVVSLDIETSIEHLELYSIAVYIQSENFEEKKVFMLGEGALQDYVTPCHSQRELLNTFLDWLEKFDPDVVIGWNVIGFDCDYLQKVADHIGHKLAMGRAKSNLQWRRARDPDSRRSVHCPGRVILDGIDLLKAAFYQFESFSLENVSNVLLGEGKLIQGVDKGKEIGRLFIEDKATLAEYNLKDCQLVSEIFTHTHLLEFALARTSMTGLNLDRMGGSVASFDNLYLPKLHRAGYIAPNASRSVTPSPGGFVLDSQPGIYDHVLVLDFKSLYPSIIRTFCIDPLGLALGTTGELPDDKIVPGYIGSRFSREDCLLPDIIRDLWDLRDKAKVESNAPLSQAIKILMNSFYGVLGSPGCRFFDPRLASSITRRGHQILNETRDYIEAQGHQVIYGDTDSVFVWIQDAGDTSETLSTGQKLKSELNAWWTQKIQCEFGLNSYLELEFETHYRRFLMPTIRGSEKGSKKRYAGVTSKGTLVFKGLENVRSDWTKLARNFQQELYRRIFFEEEYESYIKNITSEVLSGTRDSELVYRKKLRKNLEQYQQNTPPHVKAGRLYKHRGLKRPRKGDSIFYLVTTAGPEPAENATSPIDYDQYIEKQIQPIADGILCFKGESYAALVESQMDLF